MATIGPATTADTQNLTNAATAFNNNALGLEDVKSKTTDTLSDISISNFLKLANQSVKFGAAQLIKTFADDVKNSSR
jgi:hypothetical protein